MSNPSMTAIAQDLIELELLPTDTLAQCKEKFFAIMRRYGIKQGTPAHNEKGEVVGTHRDNFEWVMSRTLFIERIRNWLDYEELFSEVPDDLKH